MKPLQTAPLDSQSAPLLDDQPATTDLLDFSPFVSALREIVLNPQTKTPLVIGILGRWGTGKTTLMRMLERQLDGRDDVAAVWFSAWLYGQEDQLWAAFLQSLTSRLAERLPWRKRMRFAAEVFRRGIAWSRLLYEAPRLLLRVVVIAVPALVGIILAPAVGAAAGAVRAGGLLASTAAGVALFAKPILRALNAGVGPDFSLYRSVDFERHVGFLDRFREQFGRIVRAIPGQPRVVVFVDDLDRCPPEKALQLLDTIKVFLDVPQCLFVLAMDVAVIQRAISEKYADDPSAQREYLSKIIQLPFQLPPLTEEDLRAYLSTLDVRFPDERCRDVFVEALSRNPRELKRVINTYSLHWYLAQARARHAITPVRLAKVIVIQQRYAPLFALLGDQPQLLASFETSLRQRAGQETGQIGQMESGSATQVVDATGVAVPPALTPFLHDESLTRLLTMHGVQSADGDDANFMYLAPDEIQVYFTLTRRTRESPSPAPAAPPTSQSTPDPKATVGVAPVPAGPGHLDVALPTFGGRYEVLRPIAFGGSARVYAGVDRTTGRQVAIKQLLPTLVGDVEWTTRFNREASVLSRIPPHPHLASVLDAGVSTDADGAPVPYYVMQYAAGDTLLAILQQRGRLSIADVSRMLMPLFDALAHIHRLGIVHRDVKPSTIIVGQDGVCRLVDFGLAIQSIEGYDELTRTGTVIGTPQYMSPEQVKGERVDGRTDLYSLGVVLYECLTGTNPFRRESIPATLMTIVEGTVPPPTSVAPDLAHSLDPFMARILARDPADRYPTAEAAAQAFRDAVAAPVA